jgi:hypothetical protein
MNIQIYCIKGDDYKNGQDFGTMLINKSRIKRDWHLNLRMTAE